MAVNASAIAAGTPVRSSDGIFVGNVLTRAADRLIIERGVLAPKDYCIALSDVRAVNRSAVELAIPACELRRCWFEDGPSLDVGPEPPSVDLPAGVDDAESLRLPLAEEELVPEKRLHEVGRLRIRKEVRTEERTIVVPVRREIVRVERVPAGAPPTVADEGAFESTILVVPILEEEIEVRKRPVVREELHVRKSTAEERRTLSEEVRREEAHVDDETPV